MGMLGDADDGSEPDSDSEASASEKEEEEDEPDEQKQAPKKKKIELSVEDLERAGYKSGPSVLHVKAPAERGPTDWNWCVHGRDSVLAVLWDGWVWEWRGGGVALTRGRGSEATVKLWGQTAAEL